jgi:hypothetical protein
MSSDISKDLQKLISISKKINLITHEIKDGGYDNIHIHCEIIAVVDNKNKDFNFEFDLGLPKPPPPTEMVDCISNIINNLGYKTVTYKDNYYITNHYIKVYVLNENNNKWHKIINISFNSNNTVKFYSGYGYRLDEYFECCIPVKENDTSVKTFINNFNTLKNNLIVEQFTNDCFEYADF